MSNIFDVIDIEDKLGVAFKDKSLLRTAFTHASYANEKKVASNENLEFLGDSILNFVIAEYLFESNPAKDEGELSQMRASIVSAEPLHQAVERMGIGEHMYLSAGEAKCRNNRCTLYSDLFEAVVAAIYLDSGLAEAKHFILSALKDGLEHRVVLKNETDNKTRLQEYVQRRKGSRLRYELVERRGPDHSPEFVFAAVIDDKVVGRGTGKSKRDAQQQAAAAALQSLNAE